MWDFFVGNLIIMGRISLGTKKSFAYLSKSKARKLSPVLMSFSLVLKS